ncbi:hypothetical protein B0T20DRAFT_406856 [Sordaria brevicollis]|uniref:Uncharacterized protein n=1 Tax=Sordaria brevicollis TaxID=83679 RepID=A0AAE0UDG4_SORBR|nr:hypothetical protein B0T20DRAFT_406856 [Sordaria brevicollis]
MSVNACSNEAVAAGDGLRLERGLFSFVFLVTLLPAFLGGRLGEADLAMALPLPFKSFLERIEPEPLTVVGFVGFLMGLSSFFSASQIATMSKFSRSSGRFLGEPALEPDPEAEAEPDPLAVAVIASLTVSVFFVASPSPSQNATISKSSPMCWVLLGRAMLDSEAAGPDTLSPTLLLASPVVTIGSCSTASSYMLPSSILVMALSWAAAGVGLSKGAAATEAAHKAGPGVEEASGEADRSRSTSWNSKTDKNSVVSSSLSDFAYSISAATGDTKRTRLGPATAWPPGEGDTRAGTRLPVRTPAGLTRESLLAGSPFNDEYPDRSSSDSSSSEDISNTGVVARLLPRSGAETVLEEAPAPLPPRLNEPTGFNNGSARRR